MCFDANFHRRNTLEKVTCACSFLFDKPYILFE
jgi:hypothetical protein